MSAFDFLASLPPLCSVPRITLTYAQSLDGFIGYPGKPVAISSQSSLQLTHAIRSTHDAILVGIDTVLCDDPSLTVRLVGDAQTRQPQPVILDSHLRCPTTAKVIQRGPIIVTTEHADLQRRQSLESLGAQIMVVPVNNKGHTDIQCALDRLVSEYSIQSVMIEGGARVIRECIMECRIPCRVIVTIAPLFMGSGIHSLAFNSIVDEMQNRITNVRYHQFGDDMVIAGNLHCKSH